MRLQLLALTILAMAVGSPAFAGDGHGKDGHGKGGHRRVFCPHCGEACYPTVTKAKETKHCWDVETKTICIPKVRFPWDPCLKGKGGGKDGCPPPKCGRTKEVNVLMKHEYECTVCKYSWDPDSFKNGKGDDKYFKAGPGPAEEGEPNVAEPPPVEARRDGGLSQPRPVLYEPPQPADFSAAPRKKTFTEVLTAFFE